MMKFSMKYEGSGEIIQSFNPATGEVIGEVRGFTEDEARAAVERAKKAQRLWSARGIDERVAVIRRFQHVLTDRAEEVCELIAMENGKPLQEALETEVFPVADLAGYFAGRAKKILADRKISMHLLKHRRSLVQYRPRGVMLVISPWNFPFTIPMGEVVMGLLAGNAVVHKPASLTPLIALKARELFDEAGLDPDLYQVVPAPGPLASRMIEMGVNFVNFTGSTAVGLRVSETCGRLLIPCSMELGGKDPIIVTDDADLDLAAGSIVWGGLANAGQVCASVERAYIHESVYDAVVERVRERTAALRVGNPMTEEVDMGAMVDAHQLDIVEAQVKDALEKGARALVGGRRIGGPGQFFEPTLLVDVTEDMDVVKEESFGPVIPLMKYATDEEAIRRANDSIYGLNAYVFSKDRRRARYIAERLEAGTVMINEVLITHGCPETPWQGCKKSGVGRVHSDDGLRDLCYAYHINENATPVPSKSPFWQPYSRFMYTKLLALTRTLYGKDWSERWKGVTNLFTNNG